MPLHILLMGPQGAGKGTIASLLKENLHVPHISMGDLLRDTVNSGSPLGSEIKTYINKGILVPLNVISTMLKNRLNNVDCSQGFLLDGFPRDKEQAQVLDSITQIDFVIVLEVSKEVSVERLGGRVQCKKCGAIYNLVTKLPKVEDICDECGEKALYQREDDKGEAIIKRLNIYEEETKPLIERYKEKVLRIDASKLTPQEILKKIMETLKK